MEHILNWRGVENLTNRSLLITAHLYEIAKRSSTYQMTPQQQHSMEQLQLHIKSFFHTFSALAHTLERSTITHKHLFTIDPQIRKELDSIQKQISKKGGAVWPELPISTRQETKDLSIRLRKDQHAVHDALSRLNQRICERLLKPKPTTLAEQLYIALIEPSQQDEFRTYLLKIYGVMEQLHHNLKRDDRFDDEIRKRFERSYNILNQQSTTDHKAKIKDLEEKYNHGL